MVGPAAKNPFPMRILPWIGLGILLLNVLSCGSLIKTSGLAGESGAEKVSADKADSDKVPANDAASKGKGSPSVTAAGDDSPGKGSRSPLIKMDRGGRGPLDHKSKARVAAIEKAKTLGYVEKIRICQVEDKGRWHVTIYTRKGRSIDLWQFSWNSDTERLDPLPIRQRIPVASLKSDASKMEPGRVCEVLTPIRSPAQGKKWALLKVEKVVGPEQTKMMETIGVPGEEEPDKRDGESAGVATKKAKPESVPARVVTDPAKIRVVKKFLSLWKRALEKKDMKVLRTLYDRTFHAGELDYGSFLKAQRKRFRAKGRIRVTIEDMRLTEKNNRLLVNFSETVRQGKTRKKRRKTLVLAKNSRNSYRILTEIPSPGK